MNRLDFISRYKLNILSICIALTLFVIFSVNFSVSGATAFDDAVYGHMSKIMSDELTTVMRGFTFMGTAPVYIAISILILLINRKEKKLLLYSAMVPGSIVFSALLNEILKRIFQKERPQILWLVNETGFSFPSGHSMNSMVYYGMLAFLFYYGVRSNWKYLLMFFCLLMVLCVGTSRVYLGVHYSVDVLGGFLCGLMLLALFTMVTHTLEFSWQNRGKALGSNTTDYDQSGAV